MAHHVIYVPGLGDQYSYGQNIAIQLWRIFGLKPYYFPLGWNKDDGFNTKLDRLIRKINSIHSKGHEISLVGVSAGASAVLNAFSIERNITAVALVCGKVNHPETVSSKTFSVNPDFKQSLSLLQKNLGKLNQDQRQRIISIHPWNDETVPIADTIIDGAKELTLPGWSHKSGIVFGILCGSSKIANFVKNAH